MEIPSFAGHGEPKARAIVSWVDHNLKTKPISFRKLIALGTRTPKKILLSKTVPSSFGCLDKSALIGSLFKENGFDAWIVCEKIYRKGQSVGLHFLLEATDGKAKFTVDPALYQTHFIQGWLPTKRTPRKGTTYLGGKNAYHEKISRIEIPANPWNKKVFGLMGLKGRRHYFKLANIPFGNMARLALAYAGKGKPAKPKKPKK